MLLLFVEHRFTFSVDDASELFELQLNLIQFKIQGDAIDQLTD